MPCKRGALFSTEETQDSGKDTGTPVDMSYDVPSRFSGDLGKVVIDLKQIVEALRPASRDSASS